ncbi:MAG: glycosyltransferase [Candidatus Thorarchaeota archaeon]
MMNVILLGTFDEKHLRIVNITKALRSQGFNITHWNIKGNLWVRYFRLIKSSPKIVRDAIRSKFILVPYPSWRSLLFAKLMSIITRRKLVIDAFISNYNTFVEDRKYVHPKSLSALSFLMQDRISCKLADLILLDTHQHIEYFTKLVSLPNKKFLRVFVGVDINEQVMKKPREVQSEEPTIFFAGSYIPLHGLRYIIEAIDYLRKNGQKFRFVLIGKGQETEMIDSMIQRLELGSFIERHTFIPYDQLLSLIRDMDICLGIFGNTRKARMVIPTKVFDYAAMNKIFITGNSKAMKELFTEGSDFIGCQFGNAKALFKRLEHTISLLPDLKKKMNPRETVLMHATPEKMGVQIVQDLIAKDVLS